MNTTVFRKLRVKRRLSPTHLRIRSTQRLFQKSATIPESFFPHNKSNFDGIRFMNQFYVDNTRFIPKLETLGDTLFFVRPPRWGKSLLESTLETYYDIAVPKHKFESVFSGLDIMNAKTSSAGQYFILKWDFSVNVDVSSNEGIRQHLYNEINNAIKKFAFKYGFLLDGDIGENTKSQSLKLHNPDRQIPICIVNDDAMASFGSLVNAVGETSTPLYLIIDEYDRFANKLLFENPELYSSVVIGVSGKRSSSVLRSIFESVKKASGGSSAANTRGLPFRCFVVGLAPLALHDASGANSFTDVTHKPALAGILGFTRGDLDTALGHIVEKKQLPPNLKSPLLDLMEEEYNGYQFIASQDVKLFNPTLSLYLLKEVCQDPTYAQKVLNLRGKEARRAELVNFLEDPNTKISQNIFDLLSTNKYTESITLELTATGRIKLAPPFIQPKMGIMQLTKDFGEQSFHFLISFMHYYGVVTWADTDHVRIPNLLVNDQFFQRLQKLTKSYQQDLSYFLNKRNFTSLEGVLRRFTQEHFSLTMDEGTEPSLKARLIGLLITYPGLESRFKMTSEFSFTGGRLDLFLKALVSQERSIVFEVKSVPIYWLDPKYFGEENLNDLYVKQAVSKSVSQMQSEELLKIPLNLTIQKYWKKQYPTVKDYIESGKIQLRDYLQSFKTDDHHPIGYLVWAVGMVSIQVEETFPDIKGQ